MPNPKKNAETENNKTPNTAAQRRGFEVLGTLNMGRTMGVLDIRTAGGNNIVYDDEIDPAMKQHLLDRGEIVDRNAPIPPSMAEKVVAFEHLLDVAVQRGVVTVNGSQYSITGDEATYNDLSEFRKAVSIDALKKAIVEN